MFSEWNESSFYNRKNTFLHFPCPNKFHSSFHSMLDNSKERGGGKEGWALGLFQFTLPQTIFWFRFFIFVEFEGPCYSFNRKYLQYRGKHSWSVFIIVFSKMGQFQPNLAQNIFEVLPNNNKSSHSMRANLLKWRVFSLS